MWFLKRLFIRIKPTISFVVRKIMIRCLIGFDRCWKSIFVSFFCGKSDGFWICWVLCE